GVLLVRPVRPAPLLAALLALFAALHGCARRVVPHVVTAGAAEVYVTTGDRSRLLHREPDVFFGTLSDSVAVIDVDETQVFQEIVGFGASLTDASAWLIQHKLTA